MPFSENDIAQLLQTHYGINGSIKVLEGYDELNFLVHTHDDKKYIVKIANTSHVFSFVEAQTKILSHLTNSSIANYFQHPLLNINGIAITYFHKEETPYCIRVLSFLAGSFWYEIKNHTPLLFTSLGSFLGSMDKALQNFSDPSMHREYTWIYRLHLMRAIN